jgi:hypothetical protein
LSCRWMHVWCKSDFSSVIHSCTDSFSCLLHGKFQYVLDTYGNVLALPLAQCNSVHISWFREMAWIKWIYRAFNIIQRYSHNYDNHWLGWMRLIRVKWDGTITNWGNCDQTIEDPLK